MKFLLVVVAIVVLLWLLRSSLQRLRRPPPPAEPPAEPGATPRPMLQCAECGLHLPLDEALPGRGGVFCGAAHRTAYEQTHPLP